MHLEVVADKNQIVTLQEFEGFLDTWSLGWMEKMHTNLLIACIMLKSKRRHGFIMQTAHPQ